MKDLRQRIFDLARNLQLMNVATVCGDGKPRVRYVVGKADPSLTLRFSTHLDSVKVGQMRSNPNVSITMGATIPRSETWLQIEGTARISTEDADRRAFWFDELKAHFTGIDDPRYCIVIVDPTRVELGSMASPTPEVWLREPPGRQ